MNMKTYIGHYFWQGRFESYQEYDAVVIANSKSHALGLLLMEYKDTSSEFWEVEEIDGNTESVQRISSSSN